MSIKKTEKADIKYGKKDLLSDSDFESHKIGHRISIVIPEDVLLSLRDLAHKAGTKYQTLINKVLRDLVSGTSGSSMEERLSKLEKAVFTKGKRSAG
ncbi:MAG: hypothetical protein IT289_10185 [Oligoflexia bacterium]|nr:hypothetical protein [Oligoflexia bacterium]